MEKKFGEIPSNEGIGILTIRTPNEDIQFGFGTGGDKTLDLTSAFNFQETMQTSISQIQANKQDKLISGSNVKTINGQSIIGSGNIQIDTGVEEPGGGGGDSELAYRVQQLESQLQSIQEQIGAINGSLTAFQAYQQQNEQRFQQLEQQLATLSSTKQDTLVSGENVKTVGGESVVGEGNIQFKTINGISLVGDGDITIQGGTVEEERDLTVPQQIQMLSDSIDTEISTRDDETQQINNRLDMLEFNTSNLGQLSRCNFQVINQSEYNELEEPDPNTFYFVVEDPSENGQNENEDDLSEDYATRIYWMEDEQETSGLFDIRGAFTQQSLIDNGFYENNAWTKQITRVRFGEDVTEIGENAFNGCTSLTEVEFGYGTSKLGYRAFCDCPNLVDVYLPGSLGEIGERAFAGCQSIQELTVPEGVSKIGSAVFAHCQSLVKLTLPETILEVAEDAFIYNDENLTIYVPNQTIKDLCSGKGLPDEKIVVQQS